MKKYNFWDIVYNPLFFEETKDGIDLFICSEEGYVPKSKIDKEQKRFLDMHCKCGNPVVRASFTNEELEFMQMDKLRSDFSFFAKELLI